MAATKLESTTEKKGPATNGIIKPDIAIQVLKQSPGSPKARENSGVGKWVRGRGAGRGGRGRGGRGGSGAAKGFESPGRHHHHHHQQQQQQQQQQRGGGTETKQDGRGRGPDRHSSGSENDSDSDNNSTRSSSPIPPAVPLTFWTPMIFLCPLPDCPADTPPTTNPTAALDHLRSAHGIDVKCAHHVLPYLDKYIDHYAKLIAEQGIASVGHKSDQSTPDGHPVYILGHDSDLEDKVFREMLQSAKLNQMLKLQEKERNEDASQPRKCLFCKVVAPNRALLFRHMFNEHGFNIGLPDNLVDVTEFLETLQTKLAGLQCLYCEKIFKTSAVLRKHMRKKKHFKINPRNRGYDRYYIINYLEPGKNWEAYENEKYESDEERKEEEWADWTDDDGTDDITMCLFDENVFPSALAAHDHMVSSHNFDLRSIRDSLHLDFYASIKLINYIRKQTSLCRCFSCGVEFESIGELTAHLRDTTGHVTDIPGPEASFWSDPQYLFPCYEDDPLLMFDVAGDDEDEESEDAGDDEGEEELRRVAAAERVKAEQRALVKEVGDGDSESAAESDVIVFGVDEVVETVADDAAKPVVAGSTADKNQTTDDKPVVAESGDKN